MKFRRIAICAVGVAIACALVGALLLVHSEALKRRTAAAVVAVRALDPREASVRQSLRASGRVELRLHRRLERVRARADGLADAREHAWKVAWRAAFDPANAAAYPGAYRAAFPVPLGSTEWYVLRVRTGDGYDSDSWAAPNGREFVVAAGTVSSYALGEAPSPDASSGTPYSGSGDVPGYINSDGNWVPSPSTNPDLGYGGPTAVCADGTYSYSQHASGTCSHHGGVASWNP